MNLLEALLQSSQVDFTLRNENLNKWKDLCFYFSLSSNLFWLSCNAIFSIHGKFSSSSIVKKNSKEQISIKLCKHNHKKN